MGERIQHIAGIIFALAFIAILAIINTSVLNIGTSVNGQLTRTYEATEMHELRAFDDTKVTGSTVISAIKNYDALHDVQDMEVTVVTRSSGTHQYGYGYESNTDYSPINPASSFTATLNENTNGVVTGITFTEQP